MSVLTALLASHSMEMNSRYTALVASNTRLREKIKRKVGYLTELCFEISDLEEKHEKVHQDWHALDKENKDLHSLCDGSFNEVKRLRDQLVEVEAAARLADELARTDANLSDQALVVRDLKNELALERYESQGYRDAATIVEHLFDDLRSEVTHFVSSGFDGLVRKLLSRDEFKATLTHILSLGITSDVERGLPHGAQQC
ncbi:hypothetical protein Tco_0770377 [Tanacetum coccineum]|uniref:FRIGIDA-like protein n=1 Tax=Tanacetum coccineum TaxID=301880 RepID=A0ABQ4ZDA0_9ASTR